MWQGPLHEEHRSAQVGAQRLVPRFDRQLPEGEGQRVGSVVHHDVEAAELVDGAVDQGIDRVDVPHVRRDADGLGTPRPQPRFDFGTRVSLAARHCHLGPRRRETLGDGQPDPTGSTRHDGHATGEVVQAAQLLLVHVVILTRKAQVSVLGPGSSPASTDGHLVRAGLGWAAPALLATSAARQQRNIALVRYSRVRHRRQAGPPIPHGTLIE